MKLQKTMKQRSDRPMPRHGSSTFGAVLGSLVLFGVMGCQATGSTSSTDKSVTNPMPIAYRLPADVTTISSLKIINDVTVDLIEVGPWYNRMPNIVPEDDDGSAGSQVDPARYRHLVTRAVLRNASDADLAVELVGAFISFEADQAGAAVLLGAGGLSLMDGSGEPTGELVFTLGGNEPKVQVRFRGYGLYADGHANEQMYLTLILKIGADRIFILRREGQVVLAM